MQTQENMMHINKNYLRANFTEFKTKHTNNKKIHKTESLKIV